MSPNQSKLSSQRTTSQRPAKVFSKLSLGFGLTALILWLMGSGVFLYGAFFNPNSAKTEGTVLSLVRRGSSQAPVVQYSVAGIKYQHTGNVYSSITQFKAGNKVPILYDPANPQNSQLTFEVGELLIVIFGLIGSVFAVISGICWFIHTRRRQKTVS